MIRIAGHVIMSKRSMMNLSNNVRAQPISPLHLYWLTPEHYNL